MSQGTTEDVESRLQARSQSACFVCGQENARGLRIRFERGEGQARAEWRPEPAFEGFRGIVHGGVVSTVLDEAMSKAVAGTGTQALTAELRVRYRRHVATGEVYQVKGWVVRRNKRLIEAEGVLTAGDGTEHAHAWGRFLTLPRA